MSGTACASDGQSARVGMEARGEDEAAPLLSEVPGRHPLDELSGGFAPAPCPLAFTTERRRPIRSPLYVARLRGICQLIIQQEARAYAEAYGTVAPAPSHTNSHGDSPVGSGRKGEQTDNHSAAS